MNTSMVYPLMLSAELKITGGGFYFTLEEAVRTLFCVADYALPHAKGEAIFLDERFDSPAVTGKQVLRQGA